jgi:hypothetical protein
LIGAGSITALVERAIGVDLIKAEFSPVALTGEL